MATDPYAVLGLPPNATQAEITHAYRRQLRGQHPDLHAHESHSGTGERLRQILAAYALLRGPRRRAAYDRAHPIPNAAGPVRITIVHVDAAAEEPPLRAGPVHWQR